MLYSINYNHWGERKIWYGVPGNEAELFDKVVKESAPELFVEHKDLLHQMITHINPQFLIDRGVHVYTVHQNAGEFVITFPRSYHAGFNEGLNCAEAVNFAPPDWLKMGRLCLENYASVGRTCVFSHEELVMKMVFVAHKMSIGMCLATLDELSWIVGRETEFRRRLSAAGVHGSVFCRFEDIPDDERSCVVCRTTLFCSGLCCQHDGRMVCSLHVQQLCNECSLEQCFLKFRYTLEDLVPLVRRLTERTTAFFEWRKAIAELYSPRTMVAVAETVRGSTTFGGECKMETAEANGEGGQIKREATTNGTDTQRKIDVLQMRSLADQWRTARFPHCEEIQRINQTMAQFERIAAAVRKVLNRKIRLRDQTRCQKADTRWEYAEVHNLCQQLVDSMFEDKELEEGIQDLCQRVERWKSRANAALERPFAGARTVNALDALVAEAEEEFNVKLEAEGLDRLKSELARCQWLVTANSIVRQIARHAQINSEGHEQYTAGRANVVVGKQLEKDEEGDEKSIGITTTTTTTTTTNMEKTKQEEEMEKPVEEGEGELKRIELHMLAKTVTDGLKWCASCAAVQQLHAKLEHFLNCGTAADKRAADFLTLAREQQQAKLSSAISSAGDHHQNDVTADGVPPPTATTIVEFEQALQKWEAIAAGKDTGDGGPASDPTDWVQSPAIDTFRAELKLAQKAYDDFELLKQNAFSLRTLEHLDHHFVQSLFERDGQRHSQLKGWLDALQRFVERIRTILQKTISYYALFDIVAGRSDLPALIEGEPMPLALFTSTKYSDNWRQLRLFGERHQLVAHLQSIGDQQCTLLHALRLTNAGRSPKETCCCARDTPPSSAAGRRQRLNCSTSSSSSFSSSKTNGSRQPKRSSLPGRTAGGGTGTVDDTSPPTMVVAGRRTTMSSSNSEGLQQQQRGVDEVDHTTAEDTHYRLSPNELIPCFVCNANLHVACAQWDPFFARLPPGVLLCQRCLRSRRPCIEDVEVACRTSELPENCLELIVIQNLFNRSVDAFTQLHRLLHNIPKGTQQIEPNVETSLKKWLTLTLSLEVTDIEVYKALSSSAYFDLFPLSERHIKIWHHVRERMVGAQPVLVIFGHSIGGPSSSASGNNNNGGGRRSANAGAKRRSGNNNNHGNSQQLQPVQLQRSLNTASLNMSSCSSASCSSDSLFPLSGSSPAKQQRRQQQQQRKRSSTTADDNNSADDVTMLVDEQKHAVSDNGTTMEEEEENKQMDEDAGSSGHQQGTAGGHMERCAADFCLRPYSEFTRWIQCEAGCARWYHFCCVGISVRGVQHISAYCCYKCASSATGTATATVATAAVEAATAATTLAQVATLSVTAGVQAVVDMEQHSPSTPPQHQSPTATATV